MESTKIYKTTFDLINSIENSYSKWVFDFFPFPLFSISFNNEKLSWVIKITMKPINWFWRKILRPFFLLLKGIFNLIKDIGINYLVLSLILLFIVVPLLNKSEIIFLISFENLLWLLLFSLLITSFFTFNYDLTKEDVKNINSSSENLKKFKEKEIVNVKSNIQILNKRHKKQVVFLNSVMAFLWGFSTISFISVYKKEQYDVLLQLLVKHSHVFVYFLLALILIRAYSKIYMHIFDIAEFACNEALANEEN